MPEKFYKLSPDARREQLLLSAENRALFEKMALDENIANHLIENQISEMELPMGLCFIRVDGKDYSLPMATEEPSVIAAANHGAKLLADFQTLKNKRLMQGQIVFYDVKKPKLLADQLMSQRESIAHIAEQAYPSIVARGGGLVAISTRRLKTFLSVDFVFDTKDAMGANFINTILEAITRHFYRCFPEQKILFSILSNRNTLCKTQVKAEISLKKLGRQLAEKIVLASDYAKLDPQRAATHNKGIMNGVEAALLALGNDTRAVYAAIASTQGSKPLAQWKIKKEKLVGTIKLSLPVATAGGATQVLPKAKAAHALLGNPDAKTLASLIASVGLANNFAALKALVSEGIQQGHMRLQARSLALAVGAQEQEIDELVKRLEAAPQMNSKSAKELLEEIKKSPK